MRRLLAGALVSACAAVSLFAGGRAAPPVAAVSGEGLALTAGAAVDYRLAWSWAGATRDAADRAHVFTTDRGYTVGLTAARIGSVSLELVPCEDPQGPLAPLQPRPAAAAHVGMSDDSRVEAPVLETVPGADMRAFGEGVASGRRYCALHYLIAPVPGDPSHASAAIRGWYTRPGSSTRVDFDAQVQVRGGALRAISGEAMPGERGATVVLRRHPARALDGAALELLSERELAYAFLRGLGRTATVELADL